MNAHLKDYTDDLFSLDYSQIDSTPQKERIVNEEAVAEAFIEGLSLNEKFSLKMEAAALLTAYSNNKILSLSNSRTKILAHQVESTHIVVNSLNQRHILADEVGLGKTVEAGLVIKELIYRYKYKKIMVACPATLLVQWQVEMDEKFGEQFEIVDRKVLDKRRKIIGEGKNPWDSFGKIIVSVDFIKNKSFENELAASKWDAVIFDEAHRLRRDSQTSTMTYNIAEILADRSKALLLLTATPFRGKLEELFYLIRLVDKNLLGPFQSFYSRYCLPGSDLSDLKAKLSQVLLRRTKKDIGGFTSRHARTIRFELYPEERELYEATTRYVAEEFNRAMQSENRAVGFVMTVFQKLLDSSSYALFSALRNRRKNLQAMVDRANGLLFAEQAANDILEEYDSDIIDEAEDVTEIFDNSSQKTIKELELEISTLDSLIKLASKIDRNKKGEKLKSMITRLKKNGHKKFLIFTQFRTTQDYLKDLLCDFKVEVFNGSMTKDEKEDAIIAFKEDTEVLICTEAGGEGRNMQFCNILFNYDLPWSPLKIEQRIGRLHRFGQKYDVYVYNFSTKDTVAERILDVLSTKLDLFEESIGTPDIMLGQIEDELKLNSLFMKMSTGVIDVNAVTDEMDHSVQLAKRSFEKLSELTVAKRMDFNYDEYYRITQKERRFSNRQLEEFSLKLNNSLPENEKFILGKDSDGFYDIVDVCGTHKKGTFDSELALSSPKVEFLAFGHPLVDDKISACRYSEFEGLNGIKAVEYDKEVCGILFNYIVRFKSVEETCELISVFIPEDDSVSDFDIEEIEDEILHSSYRGKFSDSVIRRAKSIAPNYSFYLDGAGKRLSAKINSRIFDLKENLDLTIDPEIEKVKESFRLRIKELREKLDRQELQLKIEGKSMKGAVTRTKNMIEKAELERDHILAKYHRYMGVTYKIELLNAGILITVPEKNRK